MKQLIAIKKNNSIVIPNHQKDTVSDELLLTFQAELLYQGFVLDKEATNILQNSSNEVITKLFKKVTSALKEIKGSNVKYSPMYPNFPKQVVNSSELELYSNAIEHYLSFGEWTPSYEKEDRIKEIEHTNFKKLSVISEEEFDGIFSKIISSKDSLSEEDLNFINYFMKIRNLSVEQEIPFKETMCFVAKTSLELGLPIKGFIKTSTDVLRVITALSDGDISLAENTKFKSLKKSSRRKFISILEEVITEEDIKRHSKKWNKLFHNLHIGEYKQAIKTNQIAKKLREGQTLKGFNSKIEKLLEEKEIKSLLKNLKNRPGDFSRRISHLMTLFTNHTNEIIEEFSQVVDKVPTRNLTQLLGSLKSRQKEQDVRIIFPKGNTQKAVRLNKHLPKLKDVKGLVSLVEDTLVKRFKELPNLGKVYIEPQLYKAPLPTQQRSASTGVFNVARGTKIPLIGETNTLRFFIYWKGEDIDLSATLHDEDFKMIERVAYTNLKSTKYQSHHSGDITYAPNGASEFIDITMDKAFESGARYVTMNVYVFRGPSFANHEVCYAGWMLREKPDSNEVYEPSKVEQKINLTSNSKQAIPVIFDLKTKEAIWVDIAGSGDNYYPNNVENNRVSIEEVVNSFQNLNNKLTLGELLELHVKARGTKVHDKKDADKEFSFKEKTPFDITFINSELLY